MNLRTVSLIVLLAAATLPASGQERAPFERVGGDVRRQLEESLAELAALRERIAAEKIPLSRSLSELEAELSRVRGEYQQKSRQLDGRALDLNNLRGEIKSRQEQATYLASLLGDYVREFEAGLHVAELGRYEAPLSAAKLAAENTSLSELEVTKAQVALVAASLERLHEAAGGTVFEGTAVDPKDGAVKQGSFVLIGPVAVFRSADGGVVGTAEQRLGSLEASAIAFEQPEDARAAAAVVAAGEGELPFDPTLGNAHKIAATEEPFLDHVKKGGPVMVPIFALAGFALVIALSKWISLAFLRKPSRRQLAALLQAVAAGDEEAARQRAFALRGPTGRMLAAGVEHLREPRELIEEVMYETVLTTRLRVQRLLPFLAICAASAPLLGLLGTVTGIINTFKMITVFGSGDVRSLSGGISEALITTEYGLIVAIPSLLLHAFLVRKAHGVIAQMEAAAVAFANQVSRTPLARETNGATAEHLAGANGTDSDAARVPVVDLVGGDLEAEREDGLVKARLAAAAAADGRAPERKARPADHGRPLAAPRAREAHA